MVLIWRLIFRTLRNEAGIKDKFIDWKSLVRLLISIGGVMLLVELTWLFGIFAFWSTQCSFYALDTFAKGIFKDRFYTMYSTLCYNI